MATSSNKNSKIQPLNWMVGLAIIAVIIVMALAWWSASKPQEQTQTSLETTGESETISATSPSNIRYLDYSPAAFASAADKKRVLFFYAAWCPTCRPADAAFRASPEEIPADVVLFRVNYDTESELKKTYGVTYQHTFVLVDAQGAEITKWNGGQLAELVANTKI